MLREFNKIVEDILDNKVFYENFRNLAQLLMRGDEERIQNIPIHIRGDTPQFKEFLRKKEQWLMFRNVCDHLQKAAEHVQLAYAEMHKGEMKGGDANDSVGEEGT